MRAIWKGAVSFGLVSVPVKLLRRDRVARRLVPAGARQGRRADQVPAGLLDRRRGGRVRRHRQGYETEDGEMVILSDDDMAELPSTSSRARSRSRSSCPRSRSTRCCSRSPTTSSPRSPGAVRPAAPGLLDADRMVVVVALRQRTTVGVLWVKGTT